MSFLTHSVSRVNIYWSFLKLSKSLRACEGVAEYDYEAADGDEVSFVEGDILSNVTIVDDGWASGTVERTGESGMLPSNYIVKQEGAAAPAPVAEV